jgi:FixJ family two-component response regulator
MTTKPRTVYVVDDDESVVRALSRLIRAAGMEAVGLSGVRELANILALDPEGTVVADIRMPGQSGLTIPAALAELGISLPVIFVTALEDEEARRAAERVGAAAFFKKPVDGAELLDAIRATFRGNCR